MIRFGSRNIVSFDSEHSYYKSIGFLANNSRGIRLDWEAYDNKWGIEGRIWIQNAYNAPKELKNAFSAGTTIYEYRLNCNQFLEDLIKNRGFVKGAWQDINQIYNTIPVEYRDDFKEGYDL